MKSAMVVAVDAIERAIDGWNPRTCAEDCEEEHEECGICERVESDTAEAKDLGRQALTHLAGSADLKSALEAVEAAARLEREYGDDPTWEPAVRAVERLIAERAEWEAEARAMLAESDDEGILQAADVLALGVTDPTEHTATRAYDLAHRIYGHDIAAAAAASEGWCVDQCEDGCE